MSPRARQLRTAFALVLIYALSLYYLRMAISYRFLHPERLGPTLFNKQLWFFAHLGFALPVVLGAPLQFVSELQKRRPRFHRILGRAYVIGACGAALAATYLGATTEYEGSRLSLMLTGPLWFFFTVAAWRAGVARRFAVHRAFMIRSYAIALVLVWLRLMYDFESYLFFFVTDPDLRDATREWASWVVPLLVVEAWLSWIPQLRRRTAPRAA